MGLTYSNCWGSAKVSLLSAISSCTAMSPPNPEWKRKLRTTQLEKTAERDLWSGRGELGPWEDCTYDVHREFGGNSFEGYMVARNSQLAIYPNFQIISVWPSGLEILCTMALLLLH